MTHNDYKSALNRAKADLISAIRNRDHWTMEVVRRQSVVTALAQLVTKHADDADVVDEVGLQEVVYTCIRMSPFPISPTGIKRQLESVGYDLKKYSNAMAVIHSAIKRLEAADKITERGEGLYSARLIEQVKNASLPKLGYHKLSGKK